MGYIAHCFIVIAGYRKPRLNKVYFLRVRSITHGASYMHVCMSACLHAYYKLKVGQ